MAYRRDSEKPPILVSILARLLTVVIIFACKVGWEFGLNPSGNYSVDIVNSEIYAIDGIECHGDAIPYRFRVVDTRNAYKKDIAKLEVWQFRQDQPPEVAVIEVKTEGHFKIEVCQEDWDVAYVWSVDGGKIDVTLRVRPEFKVYPVDN